MRMLYTVAYPEVSPESASFMESFRQEHRLPNQHVVAAHFTMVFGCTALSEEVYVEHVAEVAHGSSPIPFSCRYAMLGADDKDDVAYVFMVPDEGYSSVSRLHDQLYTGVLQPYLRLDIPYVPHITIGTLRDRQVAKALCDQLNSKPIRVDGWLRELTVAALQDGKIENLSSHRLGI